MLQATRRNLIISILSVLFGGPGILLLYLPLWITHFRVPYDEALWQKLCAAALIVAGLLPALESVRDLSTSGAEPSFQSRRLSISSSVASTAMYAIPCTSAWWWHWRASSSFSAAAESRLRQSWPGSVQVCSFSCTRSLRLPGNTATNTSSTSSTFRAGCHASPPGSKTRNKRAFREIYLNPSSFCPREPFLSLQCPTREGLCVPNPLTISFARVPLR